MGDILDMMCHLADLNAKEAKERLLSRGPLKGERGEVTLATIEKQEWEAFKAKLQRRQKLLHGPVTASSVKVGTAKLTVRGAPGASAGGVGVAVEVDEDDIDMLLSTIGALEHAREGARMLTLNEVVRALQADKVLSLESQAAARAQTVRLLSQLREMNRAYQDPQGRWALL